MPATAKKSKIITPPDRLSPPLIGYQGYFSTRENALIQGSIHCGLILFFLPGGSRHERDPASLHTQGSLRRFANFQGDIVAMATRGPVPSIRETFAWPLWIPQVGNRRFHGWAVRGRPDRWRGAQMTAEKGKRPGWPPSVYPKTTISVTAYDPTIKLSRQIRPALPPEIQTDPEDRYCLGCLSPAAGRLVVV